MADITEIAYVSVTATCHTEGCENEGVTITMNAPEGSQVMCGCCGEMSETKEND